MLEALVWSWWKRRKAFISQSWIPVTHLHVTNTAAWKSFSRHFLLLFSTRESIAFCVQHRFLVNVVVPGALIFGCNSRCYPLLVDIVFICVILLFQISLLDIAFIRIRISIFCVIWWLNLIQTTLKLIPSLFNLIFLIQSILLPR